MKNFSGILLRMFDDTLVWINAAELMMHFRLDDGLQKGSKFGDRAIAFLDVMEHKMVGVKNAVLGLEDFEDALDLVAAGQAEPEEALAELAEAEDFPIAPPSGGKQRFAAEVLESIEPTPPAGGKQRFANEPSED